MTILDLQRRIREAGRIRIGQQVAAQNGKTRPAKLEHFRLTSQDRRAIDQAAGMFGGTPQPWDAPSGRQWEVVTESDELDVIVPPSDMAFSQHYELWSGGGCQRRCDGVTETIGDQPCVCDPEDRECKPHTRLSVMFRDLAGLGVWRLDTQGYYAAVELSGAVQVVQAAAGAGVMLPARLRLEQRQVKRPGQPTRNFAVPILDVEVTPAQLLGGQGGGMALHSGAAPAGTPALAPGAGGGEPAQEPPALMTPVPDTVPERPAPSIADQAAQVGEQKPQQQRRNAQAPIPSTGLAPRTAAEADGAPSPQPQVEGEDLSKLKKAQLALRCKNAGLPTTGNKNELVARLEEHRSSGSSTPAEAPQDEPPVAPPAPVEETAPPPADPDDGVHQGSGEAGHLLLDPGSIRENQLKRIQIRLRELGMRGDSGSSTEELYRAAMRKIYSGRSSVSELSEQEASAFIRALEQGQTTKDGVSRTPEQVAARFLEVGSQQLAAEDQADVVTEDDGEPSDG